MNPNRRVYISDTVPHAFGPLRASRIIIGGDPGDSKAWRKTQAEADAVKRTALPSIADPEDGIIGLGACMDATTHRPCQHAAACMRAALAHEPLVCHVREAAISERDAQQRRLADARSKAAMILNYMRKHHEPVTFRQVCAALGYADARLLLKSGWTLLQKSGRIVLASGMSKNGKPKHRHTWIVAQQEKSSK